MRITRVSTIAAALAIASASALAGTVGPGAPNYDSINGMLSDFQQSYGQVVGQEITLGDGYISELSVWGLYYNYKDMTFAAPAADAFTLRLHAIDGGDPDEAYHYEQLLGAGVRTDTGEDYYGLTIFRYDFTGLSIPVSSGTTLLSIIDETVNPSVDGYWHWASANDGPGNDWWRREDQQPSGQESTFYWTPNAGFPGDRALSVTVVPLPAAAWAGMALLGAMGGVAGIKRRLGRQ